jgi:hypothetical protein
MCDIDVYSNQDDWAMKIPGADTKFFLNQSTQAWYTHAATFAYASAVMGSTAAVTAGAS